MRLEFDSSVPRLTQLMRVASYKKPGRKHQKRPGIRANERTKASLRRSADLKQIRREQFNAKVRAFWLGERETYPESTR